MRDDERPMVLFSGGGTGGHLYPALALSDALRACRPDIRTHFVGAQRGVEARVLPALGVPHTLLAVRGVERGVGPLAAFRALPEMAGALQGVAEVFQRLRPELVVVTGGYAGAPAGAVAALRGVPLALQEQNSVPGVTTRLLSRFARQIHVAYPETAGRLPRAAASRVIESGNPVRAPTAIDRTEARRAFALPVEGRLVLVVGGSQGSLALNRAVLDAVRGVSSGQLDRPEDLTLLWSTGPAHLGEVEAELDRAGRPDWVRAVGYIDRMDQALAAADLALSRAGAMSTSEFLAWGLPSVLVPLPTAAADHQTENARSLELAGAAVHLPENALVPGALWRALLELGGAERLASGRAAALRRARPEAAERIASDLERLLPSPRGLGGAPRSPETR